MKAWCNKSIWKLITSRDCLFEDNSSSEKLFEKFTRPAEFSEVLDDISGTAYDRKTGRHCDVQVKRIKRFSVVLIAKMTDAPKNYDPSKSMNVEVAIDEGFLKTNRKMIAEETFKNSGLSNYHNNLVESELMGRAIYSWVGKSIIYDPRPSRFVNERFTTSHLPKGTYSFDVYVGLYSHVENRCVIPGEDDDFSKRLEPYSYTTDAVCVLGQERLHQFCLNLVSKDGKNSRAQRERDHNYPNSDKSLEKPLDDHDNEIEK